MYMYILTFKMNNISLFLLLFFKIISLSKIRICYIRELLKKKFKVFPQVNDLGLDLFS